MENTIREDLDWIQIWVHELFILDWENDQSVLQDT